MKKVLLLILLGFLANLAIAQQTITVQVNTASDDLEEWIAGPNQTKVVGSMDAGSSDLELGTEAANNGDPQVVGVRFTGVNIPAGALITKAYLQFQVDATNKNTDPCNLWIKAQDSDNPLTFETTPFNITSRATLGDSIFWGIPTGSWTAAGQNGVDQRSSDIAGLVQQLVNRTGWASGNAMAFFLRGTGLRESESYDGLPAGAAKLIIEYIPAITFTAQVAALDDDMEEWIAGPNQTKVVGSLDAGSSDLELGTESANNFDPQVVGIRFVNLTIPKGSKITSARIQFQVDATSKNTDPCNISIKSQWDANPLTFNPSSPFNITSRPTSPDSVNWAIPAGSWNAVGQNGPNQSTPDLSALVQALVNRGDWTSGNAMAFFLKGSGLRESESFDGLPAGAPKLFIDYIPVTAVTFQVSAAEDDLEEWIAGPNQTKVVGSMDAGSSDLELGTEAANNFDPQIVGVRFAGVTLPQGAVVSKAYLQFQVDAINKNTDPCALWIKAENSDNPISYATTPFNITSRSYNQDSVNWAIPAGSWNAVGQNGSAQQSSDITQLVQSLVNRTGWAPGNAMAFTLQGQGLRESESYDGLPAGAAKLIVEYLGGGGGNPVGNITTAYPVDRQESWSYLDTGVDPGANWKNINFNDTTWAFGNAPLGYGFSSLGTTVSFGPNPAAKHITTYFRKRITVADASALPAQLELQVRHDDGVVIYVNGTEVKRINITAGGVTNSTLGSADLEGNRELVYVTFEIPKTAFVTGENVIAAEVHQFAANNDDLVFDLSLVNPVGVTNPSALGCIDPNDKHIGCFTSLLPREQNEVMEIPSATHAFQFLHFAGTPYTLGGGNTPTNFDFTGYVPANGTSSRGGHLSINHEIGGLNGGVSILDLSYSNETGLWKVDTSGAVDFTVVARTQLNCSGTVTPWGTVITCEEDAPTSGDSNGDGYIDIGWNVEIDPLTRKVRDYGNGPAKLWAMGRMEHENVVVANDRKTVYQGEDNSTGAVYKFIADNAENLSSGKLYVLKLDQPIVNAEPTGSTGTWVLVPNTTIQERNAVKQFADINGTTFNGIEDVEINPLTGDIYFAVKGFSRTYTFKDNGTTLSGFKTFVGGKPYRVTIDNEVVTEDWGSGNDNLTFDDRGNLWVLQDGGNNYVWVVRPDHTQANPKVEVFMQTPFGSEPTGMTFSPDYRYMFISIQEPSSANNDPLSDISGNAQNFNKSMAIVISRSEYLGQEQSDLAQLKGISPWETTALFTIGDTIGSYQPVGIMDGVGARKLVDGTVRAYVNHELGASAGYAYTLANGTSLKGGRVSYFDIDPVTKKVNGAGLAYHTIIDRAGVIVTSATQINEGSNTVNGIDRLCSASLFKAGQFGLVDDIFFTGEETSDGQEFALDVATETLYCVPWLGRAAWENVTLIESGNPSKVAIVIGDDRAGAPLLLYIGDKNFANDGSFLDRNGLSHGKLYVWSADNGDLSVQQFNGTGNTRTGKFKEIAYYNPALAGTPGYDALGFANQATQDALGDAVGGFSFSRPEDLATNPANGRQVVLASTGRDPEFPADKWGTTYIIDFNTTDLANVTAKLNVLYAGDDAGAGQFSAPDFGMRSPDNLDWSPNGLIYIQEDRSFSGFGQTSGQEASVWEANPASGQLRRVAQIDRTAVPEGQTDAAPNDLGNWESSGILDVSSLFGATDEVVFLSVTQGHSLTGGPITANTLVEGGQLLVMSGPRQSITTAPAQLVGLDAWATTPLFTIGESVNGYTPPGILDGVGALKLADGTVRAYVNSELGASAGYTYQLANGTSLKGGRVSYFDIDPATKQVRDGGLAYKSIIDRKGVIVTSATQINEGTNMVNGIDRLCSASLFKAGQFGLVDDIFFTGEETSDGQEFALDVATETLYCVPWLGRAAWENVTLIESGNPSKVAIVIGDDRAGAPLLLYIGDKNFANDGSFLDRNGLSHGKLYVWSADNGDLSVQQFNGTGNTRTGKFKEIAYYNPALAGTPGYDALGFANQATQDALGDAVGGFSFSRPEDLATNPGNGRQVVLASTGRDPEFPADKWGTTYIIDFNTTDLANVTAKVNVLYAGDDAGNGQFSAPDFGMRSPDNLDWAANGLIYIQEDRSFSQFGQTSGQEASVWEVNPATGQLTRIGQIDRTAVPQGQTDAAPTDLGNWESSGILDVSSLFGATNEVVFLAVTQAHSLTGGPITANTLVEGGQLLVMSGPRQSITTAPAQLVGLDAWATTPLFTIGETVNGYTPPGILDGVGALKLADGTVRAYVNSELGASAGYTYQLANGTSLKGGRVSYFDIDPATKQVRDGGLAYKSIIDRKGVIVTSATQINEGTNMVNGIDRLCSASLFKAGQFGLVDDIFFTGEETSDGQEFALDVATETLYCVPWLGRAAWENVTLIESGNPSKVAIVIGDDRAGAPLLLYIGDKNFANDGSFLDRNGLSHGKLYVWSAENGDLSVQQFNGTGNTRTGKFKEIAYYNPALAGTPGYDALGFANQATQDALGDAVGGFSFSRPEDLATNPGNGRQVVLASTGRDPEFPADKWGTTYIIDFNTTDLANVTAKVNVLYAGDDAGNGQFSAPDFGMRSPDNLDWAANGLIYIQEDRSFSQFGQTSGQEASVWEVNPATGQLTRIGQIDRTAVPQGQTDAAPTDLGNWESSGILDVSSLFGATNEVVFLAVTQAHSLTGGPITANTLVEGGQLLVMSGPRQSITTAPAQLKGLDAWKTAPLFTIGETVNGYTPPGILDGVGALKLADGTVRAYVNSELGASAGYTYQLANGTSLKGGRVSYFDIDPATKQVRNGGLAYKSIIDRAGVIVTSATQINEGTNMVNGIDRLCSASLFKAGQFGLADDIFFTGEETSDGQEFALDVATETLYCVPWLGRAAWENVTLIESGNPNKVAIVIGDDRAGAPLLLYIGDKNFANDGSFLDRNGLSHGKLYVWSADNGDLSVQQFNGTGNTRTGKFKEIAYYNPALAGTPGYDALGFANQATQDALGDAVGGFSFSRPEDLATNPGNGRQVVLASTGRDPEFPADKWGTTYIIDFNTTDLANVTAKVNVLYAGDDAGNGQFSAPDFGMRSPDNLDWSKNGMVYIQEDRSYSQFGLTSGQEASVWEANPATGKLTRIGQIDRTAVPQGQTDAAPTDLGNWESSGILDVSSLFGATNEVVFLAVTQAHSLTGGPITANTLVEGGQLLVVSGPRQCALTLDSIYAGCTGQTISIPVPPNFDGFSLPGGSLTETLTFTQSGNFTVTGVTVGGCSASTNIIVSISAPVITLPNTTIVCPGGSKVLDAGNPGATYSWSNGVTNQTNTVTAAGTYTVTVTNATGCSSTKAVVVNLGLAPTVNLPATVAICDGASTTLNSGNAGSTIIWSTGANTPTISVNTAGSYSVTVTNLIGCSTTDAVEVTVNPLPVVSLGIDTTICTTQTPFALSAGTFASYLWSNNATTSSINVSASGTYTVTVTDANGCTKSDNVVVTVVVCSGTKNPGITGSIKLFPNPTTGLVNLELKQFEPGDYQVSVFNVQGQLAHATNLKLATDYNLMQMDLTGLQQGTYLVKLASDKGVLVRRLVIMN